MEIPIGERIRQFRTKRGFSQEALAHLATITPSYLGQVERSQKSPTLKTLMKIMTALDISFTELFAFDEIQSSSAFSKEKLQIWSLLDEFDEDELHNVYVIINELLAFKSTQHSKIK